MELRGMGLSFRAIGQKMRISHMTVLRLFRKFAPMKENENEQMSQKNDNAGEPKGRERQLSEENASLRAELNRMRKERDFQSIRADILDEMINIAERKFAIEIRKKSGAKR